MVLKPFYIRTFDSYTIQGINNKKIDFNVDKRKNNIILSPQLKEKNLEFNEILLVPKMIPKNQKELINNTPINFIITATNELVFQDFDDGCYFLILDSEDDLIKPVLFKDLNEDDDILIYDENLKDYNITKITGLYISYADDNIEIYDELKYNLSDYILHTESKDCSHGIIINDFILL